MGDGIAFRRIHGRIVPIKISSDPNKKVGEVVPENSFDHSASYKRTAVLAAASIASQHASAVAMALGRGSRLAIKGFEVAGTGLAVAGGLNAMHGVIVGGRQKDSSHLGEYLKHSGIQLGVGLTGSLAHKALYGYSVKAAVGARSAFRSGSKAFHGFAKPYSSQFAEFRKFKRAKEVQSTVFRPTMGLLK
jgi:hypothetical protein